MAATAPNAEYTNEIRFAVVMYGGVSLAIYINGISQELLHMVRATAAAGKDKHGRPIFLTGAKTDLPQNGLKGTERVYRALSHLLADKDLRAECRFLAHSDEISGQKTLTKKLEELASDNDRLINVRFMVDILSGTSAGGINAIYLAKALANGQSIDHLKQLWINEGDINVLINDKRSVAGLPLANPKRPQSLLNSSRMYLKLLQSLEEMDAPNPISLSNANRFKSTHVDELDLFITATDIAGLPVQIRLSDTAVYERRHRSVFHLKYSEEETTSSDPNADVRNDFVADNNPFLAFAARCTSSFPFAFEPMRLCDIDEVLAALGQTSVTDQMKKRWKKFFDQNVVDRPDDFTKRAFGDGGYLDNKPFTYVTEALAGRYASLPVDRKLIYIEPSPEHPEDAPFTDAKPDALQNVKAALLDLPLYETIREDLQRLTQRNVLISNINRIASTADQIEQDLDRAGVAAPRMRAGEWESLDMAGLVRQFGIYYLPYRRLRIVAVTDRLADRIANIWRMEENSASHHVVKILVKAWRLKNYPDYHRAEAQVRPSADLIGEQEFIEQPPHYTANQLLLFFDFDYWVRRLNFIRRKIDVLCGLKDYRAPERPSDLSDTWDVLTDEEKAIRRLKMLRDPVDYLEFSAAEKQDFHERAISFRNELRFIYQDLKVAGRLLWNPDENRNVVEKIRRLPLDASTIRSVLQLPEAYGEPGFSKVDECECLERASAMFEDGQFSSSFDDAMSAVREQMSETVVNPTFARCRQLFRPSDPSRQENGRSVERAELITESIRDYLWHYFSRFDDFDQITFPIMYGVEAGESDIVEIIRISPEDATTLINERKEKRSSPDGTGRRKLAGTKLHNFGAFLDKSWRHNDIMWGRLDGAERLITSLLSAPEDTLVRAELIRLAHNAIVTEEMPAQHRHELGTLMSEALVRVSAGESYTTAIRRVLDPDALMKSRLQKAMLGSLQDAELLRFIESGYEINRELDAKSSLRVFSRSTKVVGKILEDVADQNSIEPSRLAWVARFGGIFWGLVEVAIPGSFLNLATMNIIKVLYAFELMLLILSYVLGFDEVWNFAIKLFAGTVAVNIGILLLRDKMRGRGRWAYVLVSIVMTLMGFLMVVGIADLLGFGWSEKIRAMLGLIRNVLHPGPQ